jgi:hypothetical protein
MIRRIFSLIAIAFLAVTTFIALPATARAEGWFQQQDANQSFQEQYSPDNSYSPNNDGAAQDQQYAQNSPNNDRQQQTSSFSNNQSNQEKGQSQQKAPEQK